LAVVVQLDPIARMGSKDFGEQRKEAVDRLIGEGLLKTPAVIRAMLTVPREEFIPEEVRKFAYYDQPLPIGWGQTTSALHMTAIFCEQSRMGVGDGVLEVGGGCGYMACVYAEVVAPPEAERRGHVWSVEIQPDLVEVAKGNVERLKYSDRVAMIRGDGSVGLNDHAPYDIIIVTATAPKVPEPLIEQLAAGGRLLIPVGSAHFGQELVRVTKDKAGAVETEDLGGVAFVLLRGKHGWK